MEEALEEADTEGAGATGFVAFAGVLLTGRELSSAGEATVLGASVRGPAAAAPVGGCAPIRAMTAPVTSSATAAANNIIREGAFALDLTSVFAVSPEELIGAALMGREGPVTSVPSPSSEDCVVVVENCG